MAQEYTQKQLERMVVGQEENPNVQFFEKATMNPDLSKEAGKRVYVTRVMIKKTQPGLADFASYVAQPKDIQEWPDEYQYYLNTKGDVGSPGVEILPGLDMNKIQELKDYGLTTITKLCAALTLPAHLLPAQASARRLNEVLHNEQQENEKDPETDRQVDTNNVGRRVLPTSPGAEVGTSPGGAHQGGRLDSRQGSPGAQADSDRTRREEEEREVEEDRVKEVRPWGLSDNWDRQFEVR